MRPRVRYTFLGFYLVALLDAGKALDYQETITHINDGSLFSWLKDTFGRDIDVSLYSHEDTRTMLSFFQDMAEVVNAKRKFGVEHNGIALLMAYCLEAIQELDPLGPI